MIRRRPLVFWRQSMLQWMGRKSLIEQTHPQQMRHCPISTCAHQRDRPPWLESIRMQNRQHVKFTTENSRRVWRDQIDPLVFQDKNPLERVKNRRRQPLE